MAGRNHHHHHRESNAFKLREVEPHRGALILEAQSQAQQREIQTLLVDNQQLAATHVALKQDLAATKQELRLLSSTAVSVQAESDAQVLQFYERSVGLEAERRSTDALTTELAHVQADIQKLISERKDLLAKLTSMGDDLARTKSQLQEFPAVKAEIETIRKEIQRGRAAIEYEKKMQVTHLEQTQIMENHMISMAREIDKLNAELANAEKRAKAAAAAGATSIPDPVLAAGYVNLEHGYGGNFCPASNAPSQVQGPGEFPYAPHS